MSKKDIREWSKILLLQFLYAEFPKGKIHKSESPDFIIQINRKRRIGIEVTRYMDAEDGYNLLQSRDRTELLDLFLLNLRDIFKYKYARDFTLMLQPGTLSDLKQSNIVPYASQNADEIFSRIQSKDFSDPFFLYYQPEAGNSIIQNISLFNLPGNGLNAWYYEYPVRFKEKVREDINSIIESKEKNLPLYREKKLNKFWLLITTSWLREGMIRNPQNIFNQYNFKSEFDKVFLLDTASGYFFQLKS